MQAAAASGSIRRLVSRRYLAWQAAASCTFFQAIFFVYYAERAGLTASTVLFLQSGNTALRALLDLPLGALADRTSRKGCLAGGMGCAFVGTALLLAAPALGTAIAAEALFGIAAALRSGADSALLFDTLRADGQVALYARTESRAQAAASLGSGASAVVGSLLAAVDLRLPYAATLLSTGVGAALALGLDERRAPADGASLRRGRMRDAARTVATTPALRWAVAVAVLAIVGSHVYYFLQQPWLRDLGVPLAAFGAIFAATKVVTALVNAVAHRVDERLGPRGATATMAAVPAVGLAAMAASASPLASVLLLSRGLLDGLWMPLVNVNVNRLVPSSLRATTLSLQSVAARLSLSAALALLGVATAKVGVATTLGVSAAVVAAAGAVLVSTAPRR